MDNPRACTVVVPDYQLSLAIGKRGQNARLAAKLTGYKIDIKAESDMEEFYAKLEEGDYIDEGEFVTEETVDENATDSVDEVIENSDMTSDDYENIAFDEEKED